VDLQRETGLSADEAKRAASEINGIAGRNVQDIGAVSAAFAKVHNDLGLTGDAAVKATEQFVRFGRATGTRRRVRCLGLRRHPRLVRADCG
jgi:phage-related minor tail protein